MNANATKRALPRTVGRVTAALLAATTALTGTAFAATAEEPAEIHAIIVGDTADEAIGEFVVLDVAAIEGQLGAIAGASGMELSLHTIRDADVTVDSLIGALDAIDAGPDDVVFFYFSGHGDRPMFSFSTWPRLAMGAHAVPLGAVLDRLGEDSPRLVVALVEACNRSLEDLRMGVDADLTPVSGDLDRAAYADLFRDAAGYFVAASSAPGQLSAGGGFEGGLFTQLWLDAVDYAMSLPYGDWDNVQAVLSQPLIWFGETNMVQVPVIAMDIQPASDGVPAYPFAG